MVEAIGIYIGKGSIYITGIVNEVGMDYLSYYKILNFGHSKYIPDILNNWYKDNLKEFINVPVSLNLSSKPILRVVDYNEESELDINKVVGWEIENFLLNQEDYTYCYDVTGKSAVIAFAEKDEILDFLNALNFNVVNLENSISGLTNILSISHHVSDCIAFHIEDTTITMLTTIAGALKDYKIIEKVEDQINEVKSYIDEMKEKCNLMAVELFMSGTQSVVDTVIETLNEYSIEKLNPYISIGQTDEIITSSRISAEGSMLPISLGFSVNCLNK